MLVRLAMVHGTLCVYYNLMHDDAIVFKTTETRLKAVLTAKVNAMTRGF